VTPQLIKITAVYEGGVLKPQCGSIPELAEGDRVEVELVRLAPEDAARRGRALAAFEEDAKRLAALPPEPDDGYDVLEELNATRLRQGERPLIPPGEAR
jgi:predicted DNA-binding antitoxin AbrB/MazE fold protein